MGPMLSFISPYWEPCDPVLPLCIAALHNESGVHLYVNHCKSAAHHLHSAPTPSRILVKVDIGYTVTLNVPGHTTTLLLTPPRYYHGALDA